MAATLTIDLSKISAAARALDFTAGSPASKAIAAVAERADRKANTENFATSGAASGEKWKDNHPRWDAFKKKVRGKSKPLEWTGRLKGSLTKLSHPDRIVKTDDNLITLGTAVPYAPKHRQDHTAPRFVVRSGASIFDSFGPWRVPGRDFLRRSTAQWEAIRDAIVDEIIKRATKGLRETKGRATPSPTAGLPGGERLIVLGAEDVESFLRQRTDTEAVNEDGSSRFLRSGLR